MVFWDVPTISHCNAAERIVVWSRIWMMRAVHLSAIRSSTSREGHCASRTEGADVAFRTLLCKTTPVDVQGESNMPEGVYGLRPYVVDCWFGRPKFGL